MTTPKQKLIAETNYLTFVRVVNEELDKGWRIVLTTFQMDRKNALYMIALEKDL